MRIAVAGALFASLLFSPQAFAAAFSLPATDAVTAPITPIGAPDSKAIVCRAPQRTASGQFGPQSCGRNNEWWELAMSGKDLAADGKTEIDRPVIANPTGEGDPDAVTCRTPKFVAHGPLVEVCQTNRSWAALTKNHQIVDASGVAVRGRASTDYGPLYGPGGYSGGYDGFGRDTGFASQSSAGGGVSGGTPTFGGYHP